MEALMPKKETPNPTLDELQARTLEDLEDLNLSYTPETIALTLGSKIGRLQRYVRKNVLDEDGIGRNDPVAGKQKVMEEVGQTLWLLGAFAEREKSTLKEALEAGHQRQLLKRQHRQNS